MMSIYIANLPSGCHLKCFGWYRSRSMKMLVDDECSFMSVIWDTSLQDGRGRPQRQVLGRAVDQSSGRFSRSDSPGKIGYQHDSSVSSRGTDAPGQHARSPGQKPSLGPSQSLAPRAGSPQRKQLDRPQRWETSTNSAKAVR